MVLRRLERWPKDETCSVTAFWATEEDRSAFVLGTQWDKVRTSAVVI